MGGKQAVVVASLARNRSSLAIGNIIGAAVSDILGALSLGLLFYSKGQVIRFDRSSRIYSVVLLVLTTFATPGACFSTRTVWLVCGPILIVTFGIYAIVVVLAIGCGILVAPAHCDSDSRGDIDSDDVSIRAPRSTTRKSVDNRDVITAVLSTEATTSLESGGGQEKEVEESSALAASVSQRTSRRRQRHGLWYHGFYLFLGFLAIYLAGYVLSQAATNITDQFRISDVLFGVMILAIATTLPEKFVAVISRQRGHPGILVANCVGSYLACA